MFDFGNSEYICKTPFSEFSNKKFLTKSHSINFIPKSENKISKMNFNKNIFFDESQSQHNLDSGIGIE